MQPLPAGYTLFSPCPGNGLRVDPPYIQSEVVCVFFREPDSQNGPRFSFRPPRKTDPKKKGVPSLQKEDVAHWSEPCEADEYCEEDADGYCWMLLCRVALGKVMVCKARGGFFFQSIRGVVYTFWVGSVLLASSVMRLRHTFLRWNGPLNNNSKRGVNIKPPEERTF